MDRRISPLRLRRACGFETSHPAPLDYVALAALADSFIVRILQVRGDLPPVATVTLSTYFIADEAELLR